MKRPMTLISGLISIIANGLVLYNAVLFIGLVLALMSFGDDTFQKSLPLLILGIAVFAVAFLSFVLSIFASATWKKKPIAYHKGVVIVSLLLDMLLFGFSIYAILNSVFQMVEGLAAILLLLIPIVLYIVDLSMEGRRKRDYNNKQKVSQTQVTAQTETAPSQNALEEKLQKLIEMKEKGMISDEEFSQIKKTYVKEMLG